MFKLGIVGAGIMGANHARVASNLREFTVTAVCDPDIDRAAAVAKPHDAVYTTDLTEFLREVDAVVLAAPTELHAELGLRILTSGRDLLVEKPIATTGADARKLIDTAQSLDRVLMVGHVERFNPAVTELANQVNDLVSLDIARLSPFPGRALADVVLDLMIHDIDLALSIVGGQVVDFSAMTRSVRTSDADYACALLRFDNGVVATVTASRISQNKIRRISLTQMETTVVADLLRQQVEVHRIAHSEYVAEGGARYRQTGMVEIPFLQHGEPLAHELRHFAACIESRATPVTNGEAALAALELALAIHDSATAR
jgi:predicted dehydrogenase